MAINIEYSDGKLKATLISRGRIGDTMIMCTGEVFMEESETRILKAFYETIKALESEFKEFRYTKSLDIKADARTV